MPKMPSEAEVVAAHAELFDQMATHGTRGRQMKAIEERIVECVISESLAELTAFMVSPDGNKGTSRRD